MTNLILGRAVTAAPAIGDGATELMFTDRHPYTVVDLVYHKNGKLKAVVLRADKVTKWKPWPDGHADTIDPDPDGYLIHVLPTKDNRWKRGGTYFLMGHRDAYRDPHF